MIPPAMVINPTTIVSRTGLMMWSQSQLTTTPKAVSTGWKISSHTDLNPAPATLNMDQMNPKMGFRMSFHSIDVPSPKKSRTGLIHFVYVHEIWEPTRFHAALRNAHVGFRTLFHIHSAATCRAFHVGFRTLFHMNRSEEHTSELQ